MTTSARREEYCCGCHTRVAPHDPRRVRLDDGAPVHVGCLGKMLARVAVMQTSVQDFGQLCEVVRRSVGETAYGKLFEHEVRPVLEEVRREEQFRQMRTRAKRHSTRVKPLVGVLLTDATRLVSGKNPQWWRQLQQAAREAGISA